MMFTQRHLVLLLALSTTASVHSFSTPVRPFGTRGVNTKSALKAGFATEGYLNSLTELASSSYTSSTQDYLTSLARLGDASGASYFSQSSVSYGSFNIAHASLLGEDGMSSTMDAVAAADASTIFNPTTTGAPYEHFVGDTISGSIGQVEKASEMAAGAISSMDEVATRLSDIQTTGMASVQEVLATNNQIDVATSQPLQMSSAEVSVADAVTGTSAPLDAVANTGSMEQAFVQLGSDVTNNQFHATVSQPQMSAIEVSTPDITSSASAQLDAVANTVSVNQAFVQAGSDLAGGFTTGNDSVGAAQVDLAGQSYDIAATEVAASSNNAMGEIGNSLTEGFTSYGAGSSEVNDMMAGQSYNYAVEKATEIAASASNAMGEIGQSLTAGFTPPSYDAGSSNVNNMVGQVADVSNQFFTKSTETLMSTERLLTEMENTASAPVYSYLDQAEQALTNMEDNAVGSVVSVLEATEAQLTNMENSVLGTIDSMLQSIAGTHLTDVVRVLESAKASVMGVVSGALQAIGNTIGQLSISKAVHFGESVFSTVRDGFIALNTVIESLIQLDIAIVKVLFGVVSFLVKAVSGKSIPEWSLTADGIIEQEAGRLSAQAAATANDLSDRSLGELVMMTGSFLQQMSHLMADSVGAILGTVEGATAPLAGAMASNSMGGVGDTVSTIMNNM
mmetsp:Transcript_13575/g.20264  ORF Transcript_13575/g.20264 Transcript_13575/m.20264 type:complete len:678 (-) Transcript_13575:42-2075(-)